MTLDFMASSNVFFFLARCRCVVWCIGALMTTLKYVYVDNNVAAAFIYTIYSVGSSVQLRRFIEKGHEEQGTVCCAVEVNE
jgi:hypothetical protein